jgi:leader peptidase (prepilin peptidase)/N-methyltransferase
VTEWIAAGYGLLVGSFLNVCISRLPNDESVSTPRSYCPRCGAGIAWYDNIPVVSFLLLAGRCRDCRGRISLRYPLVELLTAVCFFLALRGGEFDWPAFRLCLLSAVLIGLTVSDLESRILPDEFTLGGALAGVLLSPVVLLPEGLLGYLTGGPTPAARSLAESVSAALVLFGFLWLVGRVYQRWRGREGLGFGDVKLALLLGAFFGLERAVLVLVLGSLLGSVIGLLWIWLRRKDAETYELPFGSFLGAAGLLVACAAPLAGL